ncbi:ACP S-malonyltransferase [Frigoribacterium faeni]|uniref:ACP S-malonyltransferase n=1 Tax=Frigoribacterium faeni TaxID=145483 RepID=UPI001FACC633|nr:ACP S-malonyltransferase [Frigoribacterium faeni]MCJ0700321.1 ACP S-malonyltransferase [Frigoribacterium faeni]
MIVVVAPGQGSQKPGFLEPWLADPQLADLLGSLSAAADVDLVAHGTTSDADTIRDTAVAQPLIVAAGVLTARALFDRVDRARVAGVAGHSVGEFTAAAVSGVLTDTDAVALVAERGRAMAEAAMQAETGMSAVLGGDQAELLASLDELGLEPANYNGGGQIVVAGELTALAALAEQPPAKARVIPLQVAGAFHTRHMQPAVERLRTAASAVTTTDPDLTLWTNNDGSVVTEGARFVELMVGQVSSPVRWDATMESFSAAGITGLIELAPAGALTGLAKRALRGVPSVAITTPDDLQAAVDLIEGAA